MPWRGVALLILWLCFQGVWARTGASTGAGISGVVVDPKGTPVANASVRLVNAGAVVVKETKSDGQGEFTLEGIAAGEYQLTAEAEGFVKVIADVAVAGVEAREVLQFRQLAPLTQSITVVAAQPSVLTPDPAESTIIHDQVLDANPGRPGAPISIPGLPIETASDTRGNRRRLSQEDRGVVRRSVWWGYPRSRM